MADDTRLRTLSLFSGIGGIDYALRRWCKTTCYCEIDPYAVGVLIKEMAKGHLDVAPIWDNVETFKEAQLRSIGRIDCITGGFPCQDISLAGKGAGIIEGASRSGLFFEIIRLVQLVRPKVIYLENVSAIITRGMDEVLRSLALCGYNARWRMLSAIEVGANHKRKRWWCLAYPSGKGTRYLHRTLGYQGRKETQAYQSTSLSQEDGEAEAAGTVSTGSVDANSNRSGRERSCRAVSCDQDASYGSDAGNSGADVSDSEQCRLSPGSRCSKTKGVRGSESVGGGADVPNSSGIGKRKPTNKKNTKSRKRNSRKVSVRGSALHDPVCQRLEGGQWSQCPCDSAGSLCKPLRSSWWGVEPNLGRVVNGLSYRMDRIRCLGNAVVPLQAQRAFESLAELK